MTDEILKFDGSILSGNDLARIKSRLETAKQLATTTQDPAVLASWYVQDVLCLARQAKYFSQQFKGVVALLKTQDNKK